MGHRLFLASATLIALVACGGDAGDDSTAGSATTATGAIGATTPVLPITADGSAPDGAASERRTPPADLPDDCVGSPVDIDVDMSALPGDGGSFTVESAVGVATPIVPNGDGALDDLTPAEINELGADTDLLLYTQWIGDHPFGADDVGMFSGPTPPDGAITLGLTVVPRAAAGLAVGDVITDADEFEFDAFTTFAPIGAFLHPADGVDTYLLVNNIDDEQGGSAEVRYVDDDWLCITWDLAGETRQPTGTYRVRGTILTPLTRASLPFT